MRSPKQPSLLARATKFFSIFQPSSYDAATNSSGNRRVIGTHPASEDHRLRERQRDIATANNHDQLRNNAVLGWLTRKHLDFICDFSFKALTTDPGFNRELEAWFEEQSKPWNFDCAARHSFSRMLRLAELGRLLDGDAFWLKLAGGSTRGRIQAIESERIATTPDFVGNFDDWINGVRPDPSTGRVLAYSVCRFDNKGSQRVFDRTVAARNVIPLGYYSVVSQYRGISPLLAATNQLRDVQEILSYEVIKSKIASIFGLQLVNALDDGGIAGLAQNTADADGDGVADSKPQIDISAPFIFNAPPGTRLDPVESKTPTAETVRMVEMLLDLVMLALDMPPSFRDVSKTNYNGSRSALIHYLLSCDSKIADLKLFQDDYLGWRLDMGLQDGEIQLPSGKDWNFLNWEFIEGGLPYWNPVQEAEGTAREIMMGLQSPRRAARELGRDYETMIRERAEDEAFANAHNVKLVYFPTTTTNTDSAADVSGSDDTGEDDKQDPNAEEKN